MPQNKQPVPRDGAIFGTLGVILAIVTMLIKPGITETVISILAIVLGVLAIMRKQFVLGVLAIVVSVVFGLVF